MLIFIFIILYSKLEDYFRETKKPANQPIKQTKTQTENVAVYGEKRGRSRKIEKVVTVLQLAKGQGNEK